MQLHNFATSAGFLSSFVLWFSRARPQAAGRNAGSAVWPFRVRPTTPQAQRAGYSALRRAALPRVPVPVAAATKNGGASSSGGSKGVWYGSVRAMRHCAGTGTMGRVGSV